MASLHNCHLTKHLVDKQIVDEMTYQQNDSLTKWQADKTAS
jgi:hypothetical protein